MSVRLMSLVHSFYAEKRICNYGFLIALLEPAHRGNDALDVLDRMRRYEVNAQLAAGFRRRFAQRVQPPHGVSVLPGPSSAVPLRAAISAQLAKCERGRSPARPASGRLLRQKPCAKVQEASTITLTMRSIRSAGLPGRRLRAAADRPSLRTRPIAVPPSDERARGEAATRCTEISRRSNTTKPTARVLMRREGQGARMAIAGRGPRVRLRLVPVARRRNTIRS